MAWMVGACLDRMLHKLELCSNDPVCAEHSITETIGRCLEPPVTDAF